MKVYTNEEGYIELQRDLLSVSTITPDRSGCGTKKIFGAVLEFPDVANAFPLMTGRPVPIRHPIHEILFMLNGQVQTKHLEEKGCKFWVGHTSRSFLDSRGLNYLPVGHMGYAYGAVMRHAGGDYDENYNPVGGFDQLAYVVKQLQQDIWTRRAIIELWSAQDLDRMALTPCCHTYNFCASLGADGLPVLNLAITIRSSDVLFALGPANAPQFGFLLLAMSSLLGVKCGALSLHLVDAHVYAGGYGNQVEFMAEAVEREIFPLPQMEIKKQLNTLDDLLSITMDDIQIHNYVKNTAKMKAQKPPMAI